MTAQPLPGGTPNGVSAEDQPGPSIRPATEEDQGGSLTSQENASTLLRGDVGRLPDRHTAGQMFEAGKAPVGRETTSTSAQAGPSQCPTMPNLGRESELPIGDTAPKVGDPPGAYATPRTLATPRPQPPKTWLQGMEAPRWLARLGNFLNVPTQGAYTDLAPSPFPGASPQYTPPPGGTTFRLRSPAKARAIPSVPTPPSSSSIPAEAIQAEVHRQLQGILTQLQDYGNRNQQLHEELEATKEQLRMARSGNRDKDYQDLLQPRLLGDLATASLGPGSLQGAPVSLGELLHEPRDASVPAPFVDPRCEDDTLPGLGGLPYRSEGSEFPGGHHQDDQAVPASPKDAQGDPGAAARGGTTGLLRSWWDMRGSRQSSPPARTQSVDQGTTPVLDALTRGVQQLQELQAQALTKATSPTASEVVKPGTASLTAMPDMKEGADAALTFQDWVEVSYSVMSDISENSSVWWSGVLQQVERTYAVWLTAAPLEKLSIEPKNTDAWSGGKWTRVNARGSSMLLAAMPAELRSEMVSRRYTQDCIKMLFKAYTAYQPGGSAERHDMLRRLQNPGDYMTSDNLDGALKAVRSWPRWLERCKAVQMSPPDPSVLARGLMALTTKYIDSSPDASFRTSMLRTTLRLDARPSLEQVQAYQRHLQAELEVISLSTTSTVNAQPKLRAVDQALPPKAKDAGKPTGSSGELCRYFARATGCKRGEKCSFSHSMAGLDKETRARKCLRCGSEAHRQRDCMVGKSPKTASMPKGAQGERGGTTSTISSNQSTMATLGTSVSTTATSEVPTVAGTPWTLETLIQAAQQVVQPTAGTASDDNSPEKTRPVMKKLHLRDIRVCSADSSTTALVDSGATHSLRSASSEEEWLKSSEVTVILAGNHRLIMRITEAGTLLMPFKRVGVDGESLQAQTIVPMGQLIKTLGYTMVWGPDICYLESPEGHRMQLQVDNGCPQLCELEALSLIARLEDRRLEELSNSVLTTKDKLKVSAVAMARTWDHYLLDYVTTGSFESGLRAVRDAPFLSDLPGECLRELIPSAGLWSGWDAMKNIGFLSRPQRRKLWSSGRWVVHLFSGEQGHWELFKLDSGDTTMLELDSARCAGQDIMRQEVWQMLMWGAKEGKIDLVMGGPPGRSSQHGRGGVRDVKSMTLVARMLWLHTVAQVGREVNGGALTRNRDVGFMLEYPEGFSREVRGARAAKIEADEDASRSSTGEGSPATWSETQWLWEHVQRPRLEKKTGTATMDARVPFWDTRMWKEFQGLNGLRLVSFDQGAMGGSSVNSTTLGTNVNNLISLDELRVPEGSGLPLHGDRDHIWSPGLVEALVVGFRFWDRDPRCAPRLPHLQAFSPEQWKDHVNSNHAVYRKDCAVCVSSRGTGKQHRRVHHPDSYVLTADVAGPPKSRT